MASAGGKLSLSELELANSLLSLSDLELELAHSLLSPAPTFCNLAMPEPRWDLVLMLLGMQVDMKQVGEEVVWC